MDTRNIMHMAIGQIVKAKPSSYGREEPTVKRQFHVNDNEIHIHIPLKVQHLNVA